MTSRCDDSVSLERMEAEVGALLSGCLGDDGYRFGQVVDVVTWQSGA